MDAELEERIKNGEPLTDSEISALSHTQLKPWAKKYQGVSAKSLKTMKERIRIVIALQKAIKEFERNINCTCEEQKKTIGFIYEHWGYFSQAKFKYTVSSFNSDEDADNIMNIANVVIFVVNTMLAKKSSSNYDKGLFHHKDKEDFAPMLKLFSEIQERVCCDDDDERFPAIWEDKNLSLDQLVSSLPQQPGSYQPSVSAQQNANNYARFILIVTHQEDGRNIMKLVGQGYISKETQRQELDAAGADMLEPLWEDLAGNFNDETVVVQIPPISSDSVAEHGVRAEDLETLDPNSFSTRTAKELKDMWRTLR